MSEWFYKTPLKATAKVTFAVGLTTKDIETRALCNDAAKSRQTLLDGLVNTAKSTEDIMNDLNRYGNILVGFIFAPDDATNFNSKLRYSVGYKWTDSLDPKKEPKFSEDAVCELCSILLETALGLSRHALNIFLSRGIDEESEVEAYKSFRSAAGIHNILRQKYIPNLQEKPESGSDLDVSIVQTREHQMLAEAQEITFARAVKQDRDPQLICGLANVTVDFYDKAYLGIVDYSSRYFEKWKLYLQCKQKYFATQASVYYAQYLLNQEEAAKAIVAINGARVEYNEAVKRWSNYTRSGGFSLSQKPPDNMPFFLNLSKLIDVVRGRCNYANNLLHHQKLVTIVPPANIRPQFGIVTPDTSQVEFTPDPRWKAAYAGLIDVPSTDLLQAGKKDKDVPVSPVVENGPKPDKNSKDHTCVVS